MNERQKQLFEYIDELLEEVALELTEEEIAGVLKELTNKYTLN